MNQNRQIENNNIHDLKILLKKQKLSLCSDHKNNNSIEITGCSEGDDVAFTVTDRNRVNCITYS